MVFPIVGGNQSSGDLITNSLRFNSGDSADLQFTPSSAGTEETFTISAWIKKSMVGANNGQDCYLFSSQADSNNRTIMGVFGSSSTQGIFFENKVSGTSSYVDSAATFRDPSAWMHCVWAIDTTQGTNTNRVKLYVNGSQITSFDSTSYPNQNVVTQWSKAQVNYVGSRAGGNYYDGYMAEVHVIDGTQKAASDFGEYNDNGVWIPIKYTGSYGTNGYYLQFKETGTSQNSSGIGADTSGNDNHFAVSNLAATDVTTDTPQNNFCTYNPLATPSSLAQYGTFSEGNTTYTGHSNGSYGSSATGTFGAASGKWYWESKLTTALSNGIGTGIRDIAEWNPDWANDSTFNHTDAGGDGGYAYNYNNGKPQRNNAESTTNQGSAVSQNDIVMHAMDLDNGALYYGINGTWQASSDPTSGASKTNAQHSFTVAGVYAPAAYSYSSRAFATNFGNPSFAISSGNSDANGYGNFEYAVPSGFYSLCTKNLAEYG